MPTHVVLDDSLVETEHHCSMMTRTSRLSPASRLGFCSNLTLELSVSHRISSDLNIFDKKNIDEANIRMYKQADWQALETEREKVLEYFSDETGL
jgi:hypothetical protein